jgi:hypothetical protein
MDERFPTSFTHKNGKTYQCEQLEDYEISPFIADALSGKTLEQQLEYYYVTDSLHFV